MTTPKKPLSKTESAIQLGNMYRFLARGSGRKLKKIGEKPSKVSKSKKIGEVQTRPKKVLQNQKVNKEAKVPIKKLQDDAVKDTMSKFKKWDKEIKDKKLSKAVINSFAKRIK